MANIRKGVGCAAQSHRNRANSKCARCIYLAQKLDDAVKEEVDIYTGLCHARLASVIQPWLGFITGCRVFETSSGEPNHNQMTNAGATATDTHPTTDTPAGARLAHHKNTIGVVCADTALQLIGNVYREAALASGAAALEELFERFLYGGIVGEDGIVF